MEITSITNIQTNYTNISNTNETKSATLSEEPVLTNPEIAGTAITEEPEEVINAEKEAVKGVIRNLLNGHFKGVADVRLRINFNDEIVALEQARLAEVTETGISALSEAINNEINAALGSEEIDEETLILIASALETLNNDISQLRTNISQSENLSSEIRTSFDNFVLSVKPVTEEPAVSEPPVSDQTGLSVAEQTEEIAIPNTEETVGEATLEEEPQFLMDRFLADLTATFETELALLETILSDTKALPELSEPNGNGRAYDKFLTIYNEMKDSINTDNQNSPDAGQTDIDITS